MFGLDKKLFGADPRTHRQEIGGTWGGYTKKKTGLAGGLVHGTRIATAIGWRQADAIAVGDQVLTFDRGMQPVRSITRGSLWKVDQDCPKSLWPLSVPAGAIGNKEAMILLPEQAVMVESDTAEELFGDPFSLIAAADLEGFRGIHRTPPVAEVDVIELHFDHDELIFAASGALLFAPSLRVVNMAELLANTPDATCYMVLSHDEAKMLVECLSFEAVGPTTGQYEKTNTWAAYA